MSYGSLALAADGADPHTHVLDCPAAPIDMRGSSLYLRDDNGGPHEVGYSAIMLGCYARLVSSAVQLSYEAQLLRSAIILGY